MKLACLDIGNTNIKLAIYENGRLTLFKSLSHLEFDPVEELTGTLDGVACSSVVPARTDEIRHFCASLNGRPDFFYAIRHGTEFSFDIKYDSPNTLGIDRICSLEGAIDLLKQDNSLPSDGSFIVTVDFGTATTINILEYPEPFLGGLIIPGFHTMVNSLTENTAQLPSVTYDDYKGIIGTNTRACIASGIITSTISAIDRTLEHVHSQLNAADIKLFVTGGNLPAFEKVINPKAIRVKDLVLRGIKATYERNRIGK